MKNSLTVFCILVILASVSIVTSGCNKQDDSDNKTVIKSEKYEPCCGTPADVNRETIPGLNIFIPNVFTPNEDGINDIFYPVVDTSLIPNGSVSNFILFNSDDDKTKRSIFFRDWVNYNELKNYGFTGTYFKENNERAVWEGQFWYSFSVIIEGKGQFNFKGSACSVVCDDEAAIFQDKQGCFFPVQVNKEIKGDNLLSNQETDCFK